jgi:hypothetical protein
VGLKSIIIFCLFANEFIPFFFLALELMERNPRKPISVLAVLGEEGGEMVGLLRLHDLVQAGFSRTGP